MIIDTKSFEEDISKLVEIAENLGKENRILRKERKKLLEKTELATTKVESMISRLRALEEI